MSRAEQRELTRQRIVEAAVEAFAELGFRASSTRDIAARAGVTQGLLTYHFDSKEELWRAAADRLFGQLGGELPDVSTDVGSGTDPERAREAIRAYVRFSAAHPEVFHFMVDEGKQASDRMRWLVDTHLEPRFAAVSRLADRAIGTGPDLGAHVYYALAGAASLIFAVAPECEALAGVDPLDPVRVERHADLVAHLFVPG